jgi:hypothetical protein
MNPDHTELIKRAVASWREKRAVFLSWPIQLPDSPGSTREKLWLWHAGRCAICGELRKLVEDHCHQSGLVRGFLCHSCNSNPRGPHGAYSQNPPTLVLGIKLYYRNYAPPSPCLQLCALCSGNPPALPTEQT